MKCNRKDNLPVNQFQMIDRFIYGRRGLFDVLGTSVTNVQKYERMTTKEIIRMCILRYCELLIQNCSIFSRS